MKTLVVGANGKIGRRLVALLGAGPEPVRAMIRDRAQAAALEANGAETVVADLEHEVDEALRGCDAVVFTAGSGAHTGPEKTEAIDREGAIRMIDACERLGVRRFVMVSSMRADDAENGPEKLRHYLRAKKAADDRLRASGLDYTLVRPGRLTEEAGSGRVEIAERLNRRGEVARDDVAEVLAQTLPMRELHRRAFDLLSGDKEITQALADLI